MVKTVTCQPSSGSKRLASDLKRSFEYVLFFFAFLLDMTWQFAKAGRDFNAHIYTSNDLDTLLAGVLSAGASRKLVYDAHELWPDQFVGMGTVPSPLIAFFRIMEYVLLKRANAVITVNEFISSELQRRYGIRKAHVVLNVPRMLPQIEAGSSQPHTIKIALYQGLYIRNRGLENLVRACEFLSEDVMLVIRGYGEIEPELRQIAKPFENCRFEKPVPPNQLVSAASSADIGIVTYMPVNINNYLASPNKFFEYIQAGLPVVASDLPFLRKIVTENEIGHLFDPRDPKDIANSINIATREERLRVLKSNVLKIKHRYSWEEEQKKLITIYNGLLDHVITSSRQPV